MNIITGIRDVQFHASHYKRGLVPRHKRGSVTPFHIIIKWTSRPFITALERSCFTLSCHFVSYILASLAPMYMQARQSVIMKLPLFYSSPIYNDPSEKEKWAMPHKRCCWRRRSQLVWFLLICIGLFLVSPYFPLQNRRVILIHGNINFNKLSENNLNWWFFTKLANTVADLGFPRRGHQR